MHARRTDRRPAALLAALIALAAVPAAQAFTIDTGATLIPGLEPHGEEARHEAITAEAIRRVTREPSARMILNVQRGVQNTDVVHQWDSESHFDNVNQRTAEGRFAFVRARRTVQQRLERAQRLARGNREFVDPTFGSFRAIAKDVRNTLAKLAVDRKCLRAGRDCPNLAFGAAAAALTANNAGFALVPNPDPHQPTNPDSPFSCCGAEGFKRILGRPPKFFRDRMARVREEVEFALGRHRGKRLAETLGSGHPLVRALERDRDALDAYAAAQEIGHALHATEDFFAHSNYVELMAGVEVGSPIPADLDPVGGIPLPPDFAGFDRAGLQAILGPERFAELESGAVTTIWLGEGDFCLGDAGARSVFNPALGFEIGPFEVGPVSIPVIRIEAGGGNPSPPPGFRFCHYETSAQPGLNKDEGGDGEPSHANLPFAQEAATREAALLWKEMLAEVAPNRLIRPDTEISVGPPRFTPETTARFEFDSDQEDAGFRCRLDGASFRPCASPVVIEDLAPGFHEFQVRAVDSVGRVDRTPRPWRWTVRTG